MAKKADIVFGGGNGFYTITVQTKRARKWFSDNVETEGWQWLGNTLGIDNWSTSAAIVDGAQAAALEVE